MRNMAFNSSIHLKKSLLSQSENYNVNTWVERRIQRVHNCCFMSNKARDITGTILLGSTQVMTDFYNYSCISKFNDFKKSDN